MFPTLKKLIIYISLLAIAGGFVLAVNKYNTDFARGNESRLVFEEAREWQIASDADIFYETFPNADTAWNGSSDTAQDETGWIAIQGNGDANDVTITNEAIASGTLPPSGTNHLTFNDADEGFAGPPEVYDIVCVPIDLNGYTSVQITYYWQENLTDVGEGHRSAYSVDATNCTNGTWTQMYERTGSTEHTWVMETYNLPDEDAVSTFYLRFSSKTGSVPEDVFIDDVKVTATFSGITISGTVWTDEVEGGNIGENKTVHLFVNGTDGSTAETNTSGEYSFSDISGVMANDSVIVYLDDETENGSTVTLALDDVTSIADLDIITERVSLETRTAASIITNTDLNDIDGVDAGNEDGITISSGAAEIADGFKLLIVTGETYTPGGTVTTSVSISGTDTVVDGDILIQSSATLSMGTNALSVGGDYVNSGTFSKTSSQTTTFTATTTTGFEITPGTGSFDNVTFNGSSGGWTFTDATDVDGNFTVTTGTVTAPSATLTVGGNYDNNGTFTHNSGTVLFDAGDTGNTIDPGSSSFHNITFDNIAGGWNLSATTLTATNNFIIIEGDVSATNNPDINIGGDLTVDSNSNNDGSFEEGTGTLTFNGADFTETTAVINDVLDEAEFSNRKEIIITTNGTSTPANYQVKVTIPYESEMQTDFQDIRLNTDSGGYIDYWIESFTASTTADVWLELPDAITHPSPGSDTIWMYYGNGVLGDGGDIGDTFIFGDDFLGSSINLTKWEGETEYATVSNGMMTYKATSNIMRIMTSILDSISSPAIISAKRRFYQDGIDSDSCGFGFINGSSVRMFHYADKNGLNRLNTGLTYEDTNWEKNVFHNVKIIWDSSTPNVEWYQDDIESTGSPIISTSVAGPMSIYMYSRTNAYSDFNYIYVRKYIPNEPTPTFGEEEQTYEWTDNNSTKSDMGDVVIGANVNLGSDVKATDLTINSTKVLDTTTDDHSMNIGGDWANSGTFTANSGTVTMDGVAAQAISGSATTDFNNLTVTNSSAAVSPSVNFDVVGTLNMNHANSVLTPATAVIINNATTQGTLTGTGTVQVTRVTGTNDFATQYEFTTKTLTSLTVDFIGVTTGQQVDALTYGNLKVRPSANTITANFASGTVTVGGNLTIGNGTNTSTVEATTNDPDVTVAGVLTIDTSATLNAGSGSWELTGSGTPFVISGTFNCNDSTVKYTSSSDTNITQTDYHDLWLGPGL